MVDNSFAESLGKVIKENRESLEYSMTELAYMANISIPYVSLIESGDRLASFDIALRIAEALGMSLSDLIKEAE